MTTGSAKVHVLPTAQSHTQSLQALWPAVTQKSLRALGTRLPTAFLENNPFSCGSFDLSRNVSATTKSAKRLSLIAYK